MRRAAALLALTLGACLRAPASRPAASPAPAPPSSRHRVEEAPRELRPALARAEAAMRTFRERLAARRSSELASTGLAGAARVCRTEVRDLTAAVSAQTGVEVGRIGAHPAGGASPPRDWIAPLVANVSSRRAADFQAVVVDLGDRVGLLRPIALASSCLACHGPAERVAPDVKAAADGRASDGATGFAEGDLRGYFWAEAAKRRR